MPIGIYNGNSKHMQKYRELEAEANTAFSETEASLREIRRLYGNDAGFHAWLGNIFHLRAENRDRYQELIAQKLAEVEQNRPELEALREKFGNRFKDQASELAILRYFDKQKRGAK